MSVRSTNTYSEGLQSLVQDVASMLLLPDANVDFLKSVQDALIGEAQAPLQAQAQVAAQGQTGNAGPVGMPPPGMMPPDMMPAEGPMPGGGGLAALLGQGGPGNGSSPLPAAPAADELARMMQ